MKKLICAVLILCLAFPLIALAEKPAQDRAGNPVALPDSVESIVSLAPSVTQELIDLGLTEKIAAVDFNSAAYWPELAALPQFDMMAVDAEQLAALQPDIVFTSGMSYVEDDSAFETLKALGTAVVEVPSSESLAAIAEDVVFVGACVGMEAEAQALADGMNETIEAVKAVGETVQEKKRVLFEISALPYIYSFGTGVYLDEMLTLIGAENVMGGCESWIAVTEEDAVASNPDVILTSVDYIDDPVGEILGREGWQSMTAVKDGAVYAIDNLTSNLPNQHVAEALLQMAQAVYPELYQ